MLLQLRLLLLLLLSVPACAIRPALATRAFRHCCTKASDSLPENLLPETSETSNRGAMAPPTLLYFPFPGRAGAIRLAFFIGGVDFEDKHLSFEELRSSSRKHLPVLQMDGVEYSQSTALLRYAGRISGLIPEDPLAALKVDEIVMTVEDISIAIDTTIYVQDPQEKVEMRQALAAGKIKDIVEGLEAKLRANPSSPYFVGDSLTIADLIMHAAMATFELGLGELEGFAPTIVSDISPALKKHQDAVMRHPKVMEYYASSE